MPDVRRPFQRVLGFVETTAAGSVGDAMAHLARSRRCPSRDRKRIGKIWNRGASRCQRALGSGKLTDVVVAAEAARSRCRIGVIQKWDAFRSARLDSNRGGRDVWVEIAEMSSENVPQRLPASFANRYQAAAEGSEGCGEGVTREERENAGNRSYCN